MLNNYAGMIFASCVLMLNYTRLKKQVGEKKKRKAKKREKQEMDFGFVGRVEGKEKEIERNTKTEQMELDEFIEEKTKQYEQYKKQIALEKYTKEMMEQSKKPEECTIKGFCVSMYDRIVSYPNVPLSVN